MWNKTVNGKSIPVDVRDTPMVVGWKRDENSPALSKEEQQTYRSLIMSLMYLAQTSRPDIIYAVNLLSQFQNDPSKHELQAAHHVMRYLRGT